VADLVLLLHLAFILFAVLGGLLALRWPRLAWIHLPAAAWAALVEISGWQCPLTPLEDWLRDPGSGARSDTSFLERVLLPTIYPAALTRELQVLLGAGVGFVNAAVYSAAWRRHRRP
jgi:hypothetical protein